MITGHFFERELIVVLNCNNGNKIGKSKASLKRNG